MLCGVSTLTGLAVWRYVPESPIHTHDRIDWAGALLLGGGLAMLMLAISQGNARGWASPAVLALIAAAFVLVAAFTARERAAARPLMDLHLLARRPIWTANAAGFAVGFAYFTPFPLVSLIAGYPEATDYGLGMSSTRVALLLMPSAAAALVAGLAGGSLVTRIGARRQAILGGVLAVSGYAALLATPTTAVGLACALVPVGAGIGLAVGAVINLTMRGSAAHETGVTASMNTVVRTVGSALGPQVAIAVVVAVPPLPSGFPAEDGFDNAFVVGLCAALAALMAAWIVPSVREDPLLARPRANATAADDNADSLGDFAGSSELG